MVRMPVTPKTPAKPAATKSEELFVSLLERFSLRHLGNREWSATQRRPSGSHQTLL
jgi:hypothetical protein